MPESTFDKLVAMYAEPQRSYHTIEHVQSCLNFFDCCKACADCADAVEFAIWFHDCIYAIGASNNEALSRDWFLQQSQGYLCAELRSTIAELIMDTCHCEKPDSDDGKLTADIDLTSFGLPWDDYMTDSEAVQLEMNQLNNTNAVAKKTCFLNWLLARKYIYYTPYYRQHFEQQARQNIKRHIRLLSA